MNKDQCHCNLCNSTGCMCGPYSKFFSTLGNATRLHIINALRKKSMNVSELIQVTGLEQTCVSHCLRILVQNGFVTWEADGRCRVYALNKKAIEPLMSLIDDHVREHCMGKEVVVVRAN